MGIPVILSTSLMSPQPLGTSVSSVASSAWSCHTESPTCVRGRITKRSRDTANKILQADEHVFTVDGAHVDSVGSFRCLGRQEARDDSDWWALCADLRRARCKGCKLSKLLHGEGANPMIFGMFHMAVVQTVLLFGCASWTVTDAMWTVWKGFHHRAIGRMADMVACRGPGGGWICPSLEKALQKAGVHTMEHCASKRQQHMVDHISARPVWMRCMAATRQPGSSPKTVHWWDQKRRQAKPIEEHGEDGAPGLQRPWVSILPSLLGSGPGPQTLQPFGGEDGSNPGNSPSSPSF